MSEMKYPLKAMPAGEILDVGIRVARDHFSKLFLAACFALPFHLAQNAVVHYVNATVPVSVAEGEERTPVESPLMKNHRERENLMTINHCLDWANTLVVEPLSSGLMVFLAAAFYLGRPVTISDAFGALRLGWINLIGAAILYVLVIAGGFILLIIPGLYWAIKYMLYPTLIMVEDHTARSYFARSAFLMKGNMITAFAFTAIFMIAFVLTNMVFGLIPFAPVKILLQSLLNTFGSALGAPVFVVFYYSCRCKNENYDLTFLAAQSAAGDSEPPMALAQ